MTYNLVSLLHHVVLLPFCFFFFSQFALFLTSSSLLNKAFPVLLLFSRYVLSDSLQPHGLQHARLSRPSFTVSQFAQRHLPSASTKSSLVAQRLKCLPPMWETRVRSLGREDPLEEEMVTHSGILAWRIPWTEKPGRLQSMGSQRVGHD